MTPIGKVRTFNPADPFEPKFTHPHQHHACLTLALMYAESSHELGFIPKCWLGLTVSLKLSAATWLGVGRGVPASDRLCRVHRTRGIPHPTVLCVVLCSVHAISAAFTPEDRHLYEERHLQQGRTHAQFCSRAAFYGRRVSVSTVAIIFYLFAFFVCLVIFLCDSGQDPAALKAAREAAAKKIKDNQDAKVRDVLFCSCPAEKCCLLRPRTMS